MSDALMTTQELAKRRLTLSEGFVRQISSLVVNLHAILKRSRANGPGVRTVIWFQGCTLGCHGCFNPATHPQTPVLMMSTEEVLQLFTYIDEDIEGLSVSGGEPLQQPEALLFLLKSVRKKTNLSTILFSGYTIREIERMSLGDRILDLVDVLIAGRYIHEARLARGLRGSSNQKSHLLSDRYSLKDIEETPRAEVKININGDIQVSGVAPPKMAALI